MLLITQGGITCSMAHVAYIACRASDTDSRKAPPGSQNHSAGNSRETRSRVLLVLPNGDALVAARDLAPDAARFLRQAISQAWAEGMALLTVSELLQRFRDGAYFAENAVEAHTPP